ncbi:MAG: sugar ABC transporter ATP-binding protein [Anaerolineae bacterium]|nr:MAG: sugar ABC transporter ATP-binding protein [Anaerolineae bacterium]
MDDFILQFFGINKSFFGVKVLKNVNIEIRRGHVVGLIGENGAGKSTLMNILGGVVPFDSGKLLLDGQEYAPRNPAEAAQAGIAFIHQELNLFNNLSIAENFFISGFPKWGKTPLIDRKRIRLAAQEFLAQVDLNISPDMTVEKLSPGERQLVEVAKALSQDARIIIFDEPTTSLTARETERLFGIIERLKSAGKTIIYISHILRDVLRLADEIVVLRDGEVVKTGPKRAFNIQTMISSMVGRYLGTLYPERTSRPTDEMALEVRHLSKAGIVHDITFSLYKGEILGVFGLMGSGRSELAHILFGLDTHDSGEILVEGNPRNHRTPRKSIQQNMAFVTENRREEGLLMTATVAENMGLVALPRYATPLGGVLRQSLLAESIRNTVSSLRVKVNDAFQNQAKGLSGGNQQKVVLGKWLMNNPSILIVDEPTRGVDVGAKYEIYSIINEIAAKGAAVLFISSEIEELIGVCDRILVMGVGEILGQFSRAEFNRERILQTAFREGGK